MSISNLAPKRLKHLVTKEQINEEMRPVAEKPDYFVTPSGNYYHQYGDNAFHPIKTHINAKNGYRYVHMQSDGELITRRAHIPVAKAFLPNPDNLPIVGHKDNNKANNSIDNLYWTTYSENSQKAVDDGLLVNDKGFDDSQSHPVVCLDLNKNVFDFVGSARECHRKYGVSVSTVMRQINHEIHDEPRCGIYFRDIDEYDEYGFVL